MIYIYKSFFKAKTILSFLIALVLFNIFNLLGAINYSLIQQEISRYFWMIMLFFILWSYIELIIKKDIRYIFFLYLMLIPIFSFIANKDTLIIFRIGYFILNYHMIFLILFAFKILIFKNNFLINYSYLKEIIYFCFGACFVLFSIFNAESQFMAINGLLYMVFFPLLIIYISNYVGEMDKKVNEHLVYKMMIFSLLFYSIISVLMSLGISGFSGFESSSGRVLGFYSGNMLGLNQIIIIGLSLQFYNVFNERKYLFIILVSLLIALMTGSRGSLVLNIMLIILYYILHLKFLDKKFIIRISVIILVLIFSIIVFNSFFDLIGYNRLLESGFKSARFETWSNSIDYILEHNLFFKGIGVGNYMLSAYGEISYLTSAHNAFLHIAIEIGVIGSLVYFFVVCKNMFVLKLNKSNLFLRLLLFIIFLFIMGVGAETLKYDRSALLLNGWNVSNLDLNIRFVYLWLIVGLISSNNKSKYDNTKKALKNWNEFN